MNNENQLTKLNICEHYYKGYCGKYDDGCFHQCKQKEVSEDNQVLYGTEHNCILTMFGECSYNETGCGDCAVAEKIKKALSVEVSDDCISREFLITSLEYCREQRRMDSPDWWVNKSDLLKMIMNAPSVVPSKQEPKTEENGSNDVENAENDGARPIDDCISRANALMYVADVQLTVSGEKKPTMSQRDLCEWIYGGIKEMPSVLPSRPQGEWIYTSDQSGYIGNPVEQCSICGAEYEQAPFNYCPNCGARMKGGAE